VPDVVRMHSPTDIHCRENIVAIDAHLHLRCFVNLRLLSIPDGRILRPIERNELLRDLLYCHFFRRIVGLDQEQPLLVDKWQGRVRTALRHIFIDCICGVSKE
jgi:hypothetical protein